MNALEIVSGVAQITQALSNIGLSFSDLARQIKRAEMEGREFGEQDIEELRTLAVSQLDQLDAWIAANKRNIQSGGRVDGLVSSLKRAVMSRAMEANVQSIEPTEPPVPFVQSTQPTEPAVPASTGQDAPAPRIPPKVPANMAAHVARAQAVFEE
jgi:hypothetical protein